MSDEAISKQAAYQKRHIAMGLCRLCPRPLKDYAQRCNFHAVLNRKRRRGKGYDGKRGPKPRVPDVETP